MAGRYRDLHHLWIGPVIVLALLVAAGVTGNVHVTITP